MFIAEPISIHFVIYVCILGILRLLRSPIQVVVVPVNSAVTLDWNVQRLRIFVNNAGVMFYGRLKAGHEDQWHQELDVDCKDLLYTAACVLSGMLARGSSHIVVTSSDA